MFQRSTGRFAAEVELSYEPGEDVVREGDSGSRLFIIQSGGVAVIKRVGEREVELATLGQGDIFGEMSLLEGLPRSATVRAVEPTSVLVVEPGGFLLKIRRDPTLAFEILQQLSGRVRRLNGQLTEALLKLPQTLDKLPQTLDKLPQTLDKLPQTLDVIGLSLTRTEFDADIPDAKP